MRIVCDNCGKKYVISDDKVRGKLFKIRCKACSHVIVVRGSEEATAPVQQERTKVYEQSPAGGADSDAAEWYFVKDGEQAGPASLQEIVAYIKTAQITSETYLWREGMDDWLHMDEIPEIAPFTSSAGVAQPVSASSPASLPDEAGEEELTPANGLAGVTFTTGETPAEVPDTSPSVQRGGNGHAAPAADPFAGAGLDYSEDAATQVVALDSIRPEEPVPSPVEAPSLSAALSVSASVAAAPAPVPAAMFPPDEATLPSQSAAGASAGGGLSGGFSFEAPSPAAAPMSFDALADSPVTSSGSSPRLTQDQLIESRSENSVLFSLDLLSEDQGEADAQNTEGSGLIDIRALAATQATSGGPPGVSGSHTPHESAPVVAPAVMPLGRRQSNTALYVGMGVAGVVILGLIVAIVIVVLSKDEPELPVAPAVVGPTETDDTQAPDAEQVAVVEPPEGQEGNDRPDETEMARYMASAATNGSREGLALQGAARAASEHIASRPAPTAARERTRETQRDSTSEETARVEPRERTREPRERERTREPRERERTRERTTTPDDDPVSAALRRIQNDDGESSRSGSDDPPEQTEPTPEPEEVTPPPASDLPERLAERDVSRTIRRHRRRLGECKNDASGDVLRVSVTMTVHGTGRVASARADSSDDDAQCVVSVVRDMRFPEFSGDAMNFTYPFIIR